jgi:hypothetical protein
MARPRKPLLIVTAAKHGLAEATARAEDFARRIGAEALVLPHGSVFALLDDEAPAEGGQDGLHGRDRRPAARAGGTRR